VPHHHAGHEGRAAQQQTSLDDLHPGGGRHAAEQHIDHHQRADDDHRNPVFQAEQQLDQLTGADHLRDQVKRHNDQRAGSRKNADRGLLEAKGRHVGESELAQVAQTLGHQEGDHGPADQKADGVDQAVKAAGHHRRRDSQKGGRRHIVAGNCQPILEAGDTAARGIKVGCRLGLGRCPLGDEQRQDHEAAKHADRGPVGGLLFGLPQVRAGCPCHGRDAKQGEQRQDAPDVFGFMAHFSTALVTAAVRSSNSLLARLT